MGNTPKLKSVFEKYQSTYVIYVEEADLYPKLGSEGFSGRSDCSQFAIDHDSSDASLHGRNLGE